MVDDPTWWKPAYDVLVKYWYLITEDEDIDFDFYPNGLPTYDDMANFYFDTDHYTENDNSFWVGLGMWLVEIVDSNGKTFLDYIEEYKLSKSESEIIIHAHMMFNISQCGIYV